MRLTCVPGSLNELSRHNSEVSRDSNAVKYLFVDGPKCTARLRRGAIDMRHGTSILIRAVRAIRFVI